MDLVDLHTHTTASDGTLTPGELVDLAAKSGLKAVAITDHDTVDGIAEAVAQGKTVGVEVVPGVEISAEFHSGSMHILGYDIDQDSQAIRDGLERLQASRNARHPLMLSRLKALGLDISMEEVSSLTAGRTIGRPHFARALVNKGYVYSVEEAFKRYLAKGKPGYVGKFRLPPDEALALINNGGGAAVLAHPYTLELPAEKMKILLDELKAEGLCGVEVFYPEHNARTTRAYLEMANTVGLAPTGGSDYHGKLNGKLELGKGFGNLKIPYRLLEELRSKRRECS